MSTSTATQHHDTQGSPTWVLWIFGIALIILFIWLWNTANSAKATAVENADLLAQPQIELDYLVGGPTRFPEAFEEAVDDTELGEFDGDGLLWSTALVRNVGLGDVDDLMLTVKLPAGAEPMVLAALPSFGSSVDYETVDGGLEIDVRDVDDGERALVFLGFDPDRLPDSFASDWARSYDVALGRLTIEADDVAETLYGRGI